MSSNTKNTMNYAFMDTYEKRQYGKILQERRELFSAPQCATKIDEEHQRVAAALGPFKEAINLLSPRYLGIIGDLTTSPVDVKSTKRRRETVILQCEEPLIKKMKHFVRENKNPKDKRNKISQPEHHQYGGNYNKVPPPQPRKQELQHGKRAALQTSMKQPSATNNNMSTNDQQHTQSSNCNRVPLPAAQQQKPPQQQKTPQQLKLTQEPTQLTPAPPRAPQKQPPKSLTQLPPKHNEIIIVNLTGKGKLPPGLEAEIKKFASKDDGPGSGFKKDIGRMRFCVRVFTDRMVEVTLEVEQNKVRTIPVQEVFVRKNHG